MEAAMTEQPPPQSFEAQAADWMSKIGVMRDQVKAVFGQARQQATPMAYRQALVDVRTIQDSLEEYVSLAITVHGALDRAAASAQAAYDESWAVEADRDGKTAVRRDMEGPRERYARHDVKVFAPLREWKQAESRRALSQEVLDTVWLRYRAVNATREDLMAILRTYAFEASLERT
jgi:hypothetical protein